MNMISRRGGAAGPRTTVAASAVVLVLLSSPYGAQADLPIHCEEHQVGGKWRLYGSEETCGWQFPSTVTATLDLEGKFEASTPQKKDKGPPQTYAHAAAAAATGEAGFLDKFYHFADVELHPGGKMTVHSLSPQHEQGDGAETSPPFSSTWTMAYDEGMELRLVKSRDRDMMLQEQKDHDSSETTSLFAYFHFESLPSLPRDQLSASKYYGENDDGTVSDFKSDCGRTMVGWASSTGSSAKDPNAGAQLHENQNRVKCWYGVKQKKSSLAQGAGHGEAGAAGGGGGDVSLSSFVRLVEEDGTAKANGKAKQKKRVLAPIRGSRPAAGAVGAREAVAFFPVPAGALGRTMPTPPSEEWNKNPLKNAAQVESVLSDWSNATPDSLAKKATPQAFDWHATAAETVFAQSEVLNQGSCGSCYAIASVAAIEARFRIGLRRRFNLDIPLQLSPESVVSCSETNQGCNGGLPFLVGRHAKEYGIKNLACVPYEEGDARDLGFTSMEKCMAERDSCGPSSPAAAAESEDENAGNSRTSFLAANTSAAAKLMKRKGWGRGIPSPSSMIRMTTKNKDRITSRNYARTAQLAPTAEQESSSSAQYFVESRDFVGPHDEAPQFVGPVEAPYKMDWTVFRPDNVRPSRLLPAKFRAPAGGTASFLREAARHTSEHSMSDLLASSARDAVASVARSFAAAGFGAVNQDLFPVYDGPVLGQPSEETLGELKSVDPKLQKLLKDLTYFVKDYGYVGGFYGACNEELMKREIFLNGPVAVAAEVPDNLSAYAGGVFSPPPQPKSHQHWVQRGEGKALAAGTKKSNSTAFSSGGTGSEEVLDWELTTHAMVAVGFGVSGGKDATPYWTIRNSWGKEFGDGGYFLYKRGENAGGIEHQAVWFQPDMDRLEKDLVVVGGAAGAGAGGASATGRGATGSGRAAVATASGSYAANKEKKSVLVKNSAMGAAAKALSAGEVLAQAMGK